MLGRDLDWTTGGAKLAPPHVVVVFGAYVIDAAVEKNEEGQHSSEASGEILQNAMLDLGCRFGRRKMDLELSTGPC